MSKPTITEMAMKRISTLLFLLGLLYTHTQAQTFQVNGSAIDHGNGLVNMTSSTPVPAGTWQTASAWNTTAIDLSQPFDMSFDMFFGCESGANGGDGMTFTFQNQGLNAIGGGGGFLGVGSPNISPALSIEFDTYDATIFGGLNEIPEDHIAIVVNGDVNNTSHLFQGTSGMVSVQAISGGLDLESCAANASDYYTIRIVWNPTAHTLQLYEEGTLTMTYTDDVVNTIFGGNPVVYWGFTAATGSASNEQWVAPAGSIIPWECTATTSCCTSFSLTPSGNLTICNDPIDLGLTGTYSSYQWSTGETTPTIEVSAPGSYVVTVLQNQSGALCPATDTIEVLPSGASAVISGGSTECNNTIDVPLTVTLTGDGPWSLTYAIDGVAQAEITNINASPYIFQGHGPHTYTLAEVSDNSGCVGAFSGSAVIDLYPGLPVGNDDYIMVPSTANLSVDNDGGTYEWYDDPIAGTNVFSGTNYTTGILSGQTTYYVENTSLVTTVTKSVTPYDNTEGDGVNTSDHAVGLPKEVCYLDFTANEDFSLDTIRCAINPSTTGMGQLTIYITPYATPGPFAGGETIAKDSININITSTGLQYIEMPLHYACTAGMNYHISYSGNAVSQTEMYWQMMNAASFPINDNPEITIQQFGIPNTRYPGLFDWRITVEGAPASCGRTPVTAYVCPLGTLLGTTTICDDGVATATLEMHFTGGAASPWNFTYAIDGVTQPTVTNITTSPYTFSSLTGAHEYTLVSANGVLTGNNCSSNLLGTADITVYPEAPSGDDQGFEPPAAVVLNVEDEGGTYLWYDAPTGGNLLFTGTTFTTPVLDENTTYYVEHVVASQSSCTRTPITAFVDIVEDLFFPNLITPNQDGDNDLFVISGLPSGSNLYVYNRWGSLVYTSESYNNQWAAKEVDDGLYYYDVVMPDGTKYHGWLNIVR